MYPGTYWKRADKCQLIGLLEHIHVGHVLSILFADPKTMVTASTDCTVSIWTVTASTKSVELQTKRSLFGHKEPVAALAVSRSLSVLLSASTDGVVILWDLNRGELVRVLTKNCVVEVSFYLREVLKQLTSGSAQESTT